MAVREQLEGKDLRRVVVPIPVKDVGSARRRVEAAEQVLKVGDGGGVLWLLQTAMQELMRPESPTHPTKPEA